MSEPVTTVRENVGTCPACRDYLWAEVDLIVTTGDPFLRDGKPYVHANAYAEGMRLSHECAERRGS